MRSNINSGVSGNARDYASEITVLSQAGLTGEAQNLISNPQLQASSTPTQLASIRNGYVISEADRLRERCNYAAAYDEADPRYAKRSAKYRSDVRPWRGCTRAAK
ncbi:hypothetical protein MJ588_27135 [Klebsiella pneumoniae]|nr:hypothetical protein MJ588_27135 [Klebsiella pneumoniae]